MFYQKSLNASTGKSNSKSNSRRTWLRQKLLEHQKKSIYDPEYFSFLTWVGPNIRNSSFAAKLQLQLNNFTLLLDIWLLEILQTKSEQEYIV